MKIVNQKIAVIYARYSSEKQSEQSIEGQISVITKYAESNGYTIIDTYIDRAISGRTDERPSFLKMIDDSQTRSFQYILVYKLDRFSRNRYDSAIYKNKLKNNGVKVISAMENITDTPEGIILESMLEGYSEYYSKELAQKVIRGNRESRKKGLFTGGACIYGYKIKDKRYVIDEFESSVVRDIFKYVINGLKLIDIVTLLNSKGIYPRSGPKWTESKIKRTIRNQKYIGIARYNDEVYTNIVPPILDTEIFYKANHILDKNRHASRKIIDDKYYLTNKLFDAKTHSYYRGSSSFKQTNTTRYRYYQCKDNNSYLRRIRKDVIEKQVMSLVCNYINDLSNLETLSKSICDFYNSNIENNEDVVLLESKLKSDKNKLSNMMNAIANGMYSKTLNEKVKEMEESIENTKQEIESYKAKEREKLKVEDIYDYLLKFYDLDLNKRENKEAILTRLVKRVEIDESLIKVTIFPEVVIDNAMENSSLYKLSVVSPNSQAQ